MINMSDSRLVAIVEDDRSVQSALKDLLESAGLSARSFASAEEFLESDQRSLTCCLIADIRMAGISGLEMQARLNAEGSRIPIIFITAHGNEIIKKQAITAGAFGFLYKPFDDDLLLEKVRTALKN